MSQTAVAHPRLRRRAGANSLPPRRRSGPAPGTEGGAGVVGQGTLAHALLAGGKRLGDARVLDRLVRGRAWIAIVAVSLLGIVFMQVSLLRLNAGVSTAVAAADKLDRENSALRAQISELDSGERIQGVAAKLGMVMPPAGDVRFLDARGPNAKLAAASITAPKPPGQTPPATAPAAVTAAPASTPAPVAATASPSSPTTAPVTAATAPPVTQPAPAATAAAAGAGAGSVTPAAAPSGG